MTSTPLGRGEILGLLHDLAEELHRDGAEAELFLVGGAAMALAYDVRRATRDLDAVSLPSRSYVVSYVVPRRLW